MTPDAHHSCQEEDHEDVPDGDIVDELIQLRDLEPISSLIHYHLCIHSGIYDKSINVVAVLQYRATMQELLQVKLLSIHVGSH